MASGESSIVVQNSEVLEKLAEREKELARVEELVRSLDEEVKRERETAKESKKQVGAVRHSLSHGGKGWSEGEVASHFFMTWTCLYYLFLTYLNFLKVQIY